MNRIIKHGSRTGLLTVPASKSWAHRLLITAALSERGSIMCCDGISKDIAATAECLKGLGAKIEFLGTDSVSDKIRICPIKRKDTGNGVPFPDSGKKESVLRCGESGSTLRFLLPVVGALGEEVVFCMEGRLSERPMGPLVDELRLHGMNIRQEGDRLYCGGELTAGDYNIPGNISSQYISGLLMALPLLKGNSRIIISGKIESGDYIEMTERAVKSAGIDFERKDNIYYIEGKQRYSSPETLSVEKDWSSAAFPLCMGAFSENGITVTELDPESAQGDKEILKVLEGFGAKISGKNRITVSRGELKGQVIDASRIPDLVPVISAVAAGAQGETRIINAGRLRFKESDRIRTTAAMLNSLGADVSETEDGLVIRGRKHLKGGTAESFNDHRIAMSALVAAGICEEDVTVLGSECTDKSFPGFWEEMEKLKYEQ